jgi:hypothetical protein
MTAIITAVVLDVACPACFEPQPNTADGSHLWTPEQVRAVAGQPIQCAACRYPFRVLPPKRVIW